MADANAPSRPPSWWKRARLRSALGLAAVLMLVALAVLLAASRTGTIPFRGRVVLVPLRTGSIRVSVSEGRARFIEPGPPDLKALLEERSPDLGFRFDDQLGAMYSIVSTRGDGLRVVLVTEQVMSRFVQVDCYVEEDTSGARRTK